MKRESGYKILTINLRSIGQCLDKIIDSIKCLFTKKSTEREKEASDFFWNYNWSLILKEERTTKKINNTSP